MISLELNFCPFSIFFILLFRLSYSQLGSSTIPIAISASQAFPCKDTEIAPFSIKSKLAFFSKGAGWRTYTLRFLRNPSMTPDQVPPLLSDYAT